MRVLDIGAGPRSSADTQIDIFKWEKTTHVLDAMMEKLPFEDETFDEVRMEQFLEHCPPSVHYKEDGVWKTHRPRIHVMKESYRVLKHGGILHVSVPAEIHEWAQDPTHEGPIILEGFFSYFCGEWGGAKQGEFVNDAYGLDIAFEMIEHFRTGFILTVRMRKP